MSLDGFIADRLAHFDEDVLRFINDETRKIGTEIYGRRMYEEMVYLGILRGQKAGPNTRMNLLVSGRGSTSW